MISIHAPAKGATLWRLRLLVLLRFQSTLPRRERPAAAGRSGSIPAISIHAPAKGATIQRQNVLRTVQFQSTLPRRERRYLVRSVPPSPAFQSTLPRRERRSGTTVPANGNLFQSTLPRRERQGSSTCFWRYTDFNPRSREGSDGRSIRFKGTVRISIHAPAKGATLMDNGNKGLEGISIHAPAKGAT